MPIAVSFRLVTHFCLRQREHLDKTISQSRKGRRWAAHALGALFLTRELPWTADTSIVVLEMVVQVCVVVVAGKKARG